MNPKKLLVVVVGPTAVGKTALTISLAEHFGGEIISCDSRQFYREMKIGTAKPSQEELARVQHHFIESHSIDEDYDAGAFAEDARAKLTQLFQKNNVQFMVGGSGLYVKAVCEGLDAMPEVIPELREQLNNQFEREGLDGLLGELQLADPEYFATVDKQNPQRVIRGLEVFRSTRKKYSEFRQGQSVVIHDFDILKIGLEQDRATLYQRIDSRMDQMIAEGLFEEAKMLYPHRKNNALQTVGYKEIFDFIDGEYDQAEAIRLLKRNSRRYAKRQMTWFRKDQSVIWHTIDQKDLIIDQINNYLQ